MDAIDANLERYRQEILQHNIRAGTTVDERYDLPLIFQPGEGWCYGGSITWAGKVVESVGGMTLEEYMREHIFKPLDITGATFFPHKHPEILSRLARNTFRDPDSGKLSDYPPGHGEMFKFEMVDAFGGEGLYADLSEYFRLLRSLLVDDGKLLKKETAAMMFKPQLPTKESKEMLRETIESQHWMIGDFSGVNEYDWGFGGLLIDGDGHGWRKKGCLIWSGAANLFWVSCIVVSQFS
jgi:CubicO group peptidase (beta-lactamase class C family)